MINVLFYTSTFRNFRNVLLGHLLELQSKPNFRIYLLIEKFDKEFIDLLNSKNIFPNVVSVIEINQYTPQSSSIFKEYKRLHKLVTHLYRYNKFNFVIGTSDFHSIFELILFRIARQNKSYTISISATIAGNMKNIARWIDLVNLAQLISNKPNFLNYFFIISRKYIGHFFYYFLLPISNFHFPFWGKSSFVLNIGQSGMRDANTHIVFSEREKDIFILNGVKARKLLIMPPDFSGIFNLFNEQNLFINKIEKFDFLVLLPALNIGFNKGVYSLIDSNERKFKRLQVIELIIDKFPNSKIIIKPHPLIENNDEIKNEYLNKFPNISFAKPGIHVDEYISRAKIIIDLPMSQSSTLFLGKFQFPNKIFVSLDLHKEFEGDYYKKNKYSILYFDNIDEVTHWLTNLDPDNHNQLVLNSSANSKLSISDFLLSNL